MFQKIATSLAVLLLLVSCDKKQEANTSESAQAPRRSTRADRPSRNVPGTRDKLRNAFEQAKAMAPGEERESALAQVARKALDTSPDIASEAIKEMQAGSDAKISLIEAYIRKLLEVDRVDEALAWAVDLGNEKDTAVARAMIAELVATSNPERVAGMLSPSSFTAAGVDPAAEQIFQNWVATNPTRAAEWVTKMPTGEARNAGWKALLTTWINLDSKTAFSWVSSQKNTMIREEAVDAMVALLVGQPDPIRSIQLESAAENFQQEIERRIAALTPAPEPEPEPDMTEGQAIN